MSGKAELTERDAREQERFFALLSDGARPLHAAVEVGWSPAKLRRLTRDPEFAELMATAEEMLDETIEESLYQSALKGNFRAQQMWLLNRQGKKWRDVRHIQIDQRQTLEVGVVLGVKQAAAELLRSNGIAALQPGGALDPLDVESVEDEHPAGT
jgi:hypothetical protein